MMLITLGMLNLFTTLMPNSDAPSLPAKCDKPSGLGFNFMENNIPHYKNYTLEILSEIVDGIFYKEEWKPMIDAETMYAISNFGRIKSLKRTIIKGGKFKSKKCPLSEKILKQTIMQSGGYCGIKLYSNNSKKQANFTVHRLVGLHFIPNPDNLPEVNHLKGIKTDNRFHQLKWSTKSDNILHAFQIGLKKPPLEFINIGAKNPKSKPVEQYTVDGEYIKTFAGQTEAERLTGISQSTIWLSCNGKPTNNSRFIWKYPKGISLGKRGAVKTSKNYYNK